LMSEALMFAYSPSIILGAGAVFGAATRVSFLRTLQGIVSLARSGAVVVGVLSVVVLTYNYGGRQVHNLCWYFSMVFVLAYVFLMIVRSGQARK
jgi:hypothetical protein